MKRTARTIILVLAATAAISFVARGDAYQEYIETYGGMAVEQQQLHGIPASITLAQGLLESNAGRSRLATYGNNHFGIKCHNTWTGDTMLRNDDSRNECFRVYDKAEDSFNDHSRFLLRERYASLFKLDPLDYTAWAKGLKKCGYATDPNYASRLTAIIERYALYVYDSDAGRNAEENAAFIQSTLAASHPVRRTRGIHYVIAAPGDTYKTIAKEFNVDVKKLLEYNDVRRNRTIKDWEEVYLEPKLAEAPSDLKTIVIGEGESIHSVSQRLGVSMKMLLDLNPKVRDKSGETLKLH